MSALRLEIPAPFLRSLDAKTSIFFGSAASSTPNAPHGPPRQVDEARAEIVEGVERGINPIVTLENQPLNMIANLV